MTTMTSTHRSVSGKKSSAHAYQMFAVVEQERIREQRIACYGDLKPELKIRPNYEAQLMAPAHRRHAAKFKVSGAT
ncbi:hypothetical protein DFS34DRAFT_650167 [Phlyctochytrium arcticum]|nr:hypothetical protein DFS34DRAFT_650167 [Phlyctochytrium arcticum]